MNLHHSIVRASDRLSVRVFVCPAIRPPLAQLAQRLRQTNQGMLTDLPILQLLGQKAADVTRYALLLLNVGDAKFLTFDVGNLHV